MNCAQDEGCGRRLLEAKAAEAAEAEERRLQSLTDDVMDAASANADAVPLCWKDDSYAPSDIASTHSLDYVEPSSATDANYDASGVGYANRHWGRGDSTLFNAHNLIYVGYTKPTTSWDA